MDEFVQSLDKIADLFLSQQISNTSPDLIRLNNLWEEDNSYEYIEPILNLYKNPYTLQCGLNILKHYSEELWSQISFETQKIIYELAVKNLDNPKIYGASYSRLCCYIVLMIVRFPDEIRKQFLAYFFQERKDLTILNEFILLLTDDQFEFDRKELKEFVFQNFSNFLPLIEQKYAEPIAYKTLQNLIPLLPSQNFNDFHIDYLILTYFDEFYILIPQISTKMAISDEIINSFIEKYLQNASNEDDYFDFENFVMIYYDHITDDNLRSINEQFLEDFDSYLNFWEFFSLRIHQEFIGGKFEMTDAISELLVHIAHHVVRNIPPPPDCFYDGNAYQSQISLNEQEFMKLRRIWIVLNTIDSDLVTETIKELFEEISENSEDSRVLESFIFCTALCDGIDDDFGPKVFDFVDEKYSGEEIPEYCHSIFLYMVKRFIECKIIPSDYFQNVVNLALKFVSSPTVGKQATELLYLISKKEPEIMSDKIDLKQLKTILLNSDILIQLSQTLCTNSKSLSNGLKDIISEIWAEVEANPLENFEKFRKLLCILIGFSRAKINFAKEFIVGNLDSLESINRQYINLFLDLLNQIGLNTRKHPHFVLVNDIMNLELTILDELNFYQNLNLFSELTKVPTVFRPYKIYDLINHIFETSSEIDLISFLLQNFIYEANENMIVSKIWYNRDVICAFRALTTVFQKHFELIREEDKKFLVIMLNKNEFGLRDMIISNCFAVISHFSSDNIEFIVEFSKQIITSIIYTIYSDEYFSEKDFDSFSEIIFTLFSLIGDKEPIISHINEELSGKLITCTDDVYSFIDEFLRQSNSTQEVKECLMQFRANAKNQNIDEIKLQFLIESIRDDPSFL